jgi:choline-sulfatase
MSLALALALCSVLALLPGCTRDWRVGDEDPPNIVLIVVDTLRADHLGCYGYERATSPNLDILAERATVFERAYSHSPWTMPSIASILTGLEPREHGIAKWEDPLELQLVTLAEHLQAHGYRTGAAVSHWILRPDYHYDQGFEVYNTGALELGSPHQTRSSPTISHMGTKLTLTKRSEPFFVMLHYFDPHSGYLPHKDFSFGDEAMDLYDGEIAYTDQHIGQLLDRMASREQLRDTIVVVIADHGEAFGEHGHNEHTLSLYEELVRVPLIVYVPGFEPRRLEQVVAETQLAPTLLALAGLPIPPSMSAPSLPFDQAGFLPAEDQRVFAETKLGVDKHAVVDGDWKLHHDRRRRRHELYDLANDPGETSDVRGEHTERSTELKGVLREHRALPRATVSSKALSDDTRQALEALGYLGGADEPAPEQADGPHQEHPVLQAGPIGAP